MRQGLEQWAEHQWGDGQEAVRNPARPEDIVGHVDWAQADQITAQMDIAQQAQPSWDGLAAERAPILRRYGALLETHSDELCGLLVREAGKTWQDAIDEIREAVDFCRYYAHQCEQHFTQAATCLLYTSPSPRD